MQDGIRGVGVVEQHLLDGVFGGRRSSLHLATAMAMERSEVWLFVFSVCFIRLVYLSMPKGLQVCIFR